MQRPRLESNFLPDCCKYTKKLCCFESSFLLPKGDRRRLLHRQFVAGIEERVRRFGARLDPDFHANGHSHEDMEARHLHRGGCLGRTGSRPVGRIGIHCFAKLAKNRGVDCVRFVPKRLNVLNELRSQSFGFKTTRKWRGGHRSTSIREA
jgi:hypothetical protein